MSLFRRSSIRSLLFALALVAVAVVAVIFAAGHSTGPNGGNGFHYGWDKARNASAQGPGHVNNPPPSAPPAVTPTPVGTPVAPDQDPDVIDSSAQSAPLEVEQPIDASATSGSSSSTSTTSVSQTSTVTSATPLPPFPVPQQ